MDNVPLEHLDRLRRHLSLDASQLAHRWYGPDAAANHAPVVYLYLLHLGLHATRLWCAAAGHRSTMIGSDLLLDDGHLTRQLPLLTLAGEVTDPAAQALLHDLALSLAGPDQEAAGPSAVTRVDVVAELILARRTAALQAVLAGPGLVTGEGRA